MYPGAQPAAGCRSPIRDRWHWEGSGCEVEAARGLYLGRGALWLRGADETDRRARFYAFGQIVSLGEIDDLPTRYLLPRPQCVHQGQVLGCLGVGGNERCPARGNTDSEVYDRRFGQRGLAQRQEYGRSSPRTCVGIALEHISVALVGSHYSTIIEFLDVSNLQHVRFTTRDVRV